MLHEVLLALSGHPSPLFNTHTDGQEDNFDPLTPSENALLHSIGELADVHRKLRQHISEIASHHRSMICRAVATSIQHKHLCRFQKKIIDVEARILTNDASIVGAYEIVPLASVVAEFDDWHRLMAWYWEIATFMQRPRENPTHARSSGVASCTGASLIDQLREEQHTGFPEIEEAAIELSKAAETAWMRQLASWILYGTLPVHGGDDFFIHSTEAEDGKGLRFTKEKDLLPKFVSPPTAQSILLIGRSLHQVREYGRRAVSDAKAKGFGHSHSDDDLVTKHLQLLSEQAVPIVPAQLSRTITSIRFSFSQNVLQHLLPMDLTLRLLSSMKQFFLLSRGDFAFTLVNEVEGRLQARQQSMGKLLQQDTVKAIQGLAIRDTEMHQTLSLTFRALALQNMDDEDEVLEFARAHMTLSTSSGIESRPTSSDSLYHSLPNIAPVAFDDLLFPTAAKLKLAVPEPLDLFMSSTDAETYSSINAYLLAIERAYLRLSDLWKKTPARRDPISDKASLEAKTRQADRRIAARKIWATCSAAVFLLSETARYLEGEIIKESWDVFEQWVNPQPTKTSSSRTDKPVASTDNSTTSEGIAQKDPETLASGHRTFLAALTYSLLLTDLPYTRDLRSLLGNVDQLIVFFTLLLNIQQRADTELLSIGASGGSAAAGGAGGWSHTASEEQRISLELDRARKKVDSDLKSVVNRLRQLDHERIGSGRYLDVGISESGFQPWKGGGVDRLLMKLEFGRMAAGSSVGGDVSMPSIV